MKNCYINNGTLNNDYKSGERRLFQGILVIFIPEITILTIGKSLKYWKIKEKSRIYKKNYK